MLHIYCTPLTFTDFLTHNGIVLCTYFCYNLFVSFNYIFENIYICYRLLCKIMQYSCSISKYAPLNIPTLPHINMFRICCTENIWISLQLHNFIVIYSDSCEAV